MRRSSREVPLLAVPVLAGGDGVDGTALSFLVRRAVEDRKREEEKKLREEEEEEQEEAPQVLFWCADTTLWARVPLSLFFFWCAAFPSVDDRPKMLDIMAGTEQKYSYVLLMCKVGFLGYVAPRAVFPSLSSGPRCSASWPVWTRMIFSACARLGLLVFDDVPRAVLLLVVSGPRC